MNYLFARVLLERTHYETDLVRWQYLEPTVSTIDQLQEIYRTYCIYKHFASVMPLFHNQFVNPDTDIIGYYDSDVLVAFSLIRRLDPTHALCEQFAWTYHRPRLRLGIQTLKVECAIYKQRGFHSLYLEQAHLYKQQIDGFELLGPMT
jgi:hypothetical protein